MVTHFCSGEGAIKSSKSSKSSAIVTFWVFARDLGAVRKKRLQGSREKRGISKLARASERRRRETQQVHTPQVRNLTLSLLLTCPPCSREINAEASIVRREPCRQANSPTFILRCAPSLGLLPSLYNQQRLTHGRQYFHFISTPFARAGHDLCGPGELPADPWLLTLTCQAERAHVGSIAPLLARRVSAEVLVGRLGCFVGRLLMQTFVPGAQPL